MTVETFLEEKPTLSEFESCIAQYEHFHNHVTSLPDSYVIGAVLYDTTPLKEAIKTEAETWKKTYGRALANQVIFIFFPSIFSFLFINFDSDLKTY